MPKKNKPARRSSAVVDADAGSESSRFSLLTPATTPPPPKCKTCSRKANKKEVNAHEEEEDVDATSDSSSDDNSSAAPATEKFDYQLALAKQTKARKAAEQRLQDECKQLWAGMARFLRHTERPFGPVDPMLANLPPVVPTYASGAPDQLPDTFGPWSITMFEGQVALDMAKKAFLNALTEAERKAKILPEPLPLPPCEPIELPWMTTPRKKTWSESITIKTARESLGLVWKFCSVLVLIMALVRLPGLMGGMARLMEQQASERRGFWGR